ncbi:MAG: triphosphoribosyl-dephospho-CoA synthase [Thermoprotei archaeon]
MKFQISYSYLISIALSSAISLEVAAYPKPGNVHRFHDYKDTKFEDFLITSHVMQPIFIEVFNRSLNNNQIEVGKAIYLAVKFARKIHGGGNTNLGLATLLIPLAAGVAQCLPRLDIREIVFKAQDIVKNSNVEDAIMFYKAIREASPSYVKKYKPEKTSLPDVFIENFESELKRNNYTLWDVLTESASWDIVSRELINGYPESIFVKKFIEKNLSKIGWNNSIISAYIHLLSERPDSLIIRKGNKEIAVLIMNEAAEIKKLRKIYGKKGLKMLKELDRKLNELNLNPGSTADIIASGIALYNIQRMLSINMRELVDYFH